MNDLILYTTDDGRSQIKLRDKDQSVWLTQLEMAELFDATKQNISLHLKNLFEEGELDPAATVKESLTVQIEGSREVQRPVNLIQPQCHPGRGLSGAFTARCAVSQVGIHRA
jgi:hypothetical protein